MKYKLRRCIMTGICVALVSGGIDSPVAVARMLMKGWKIFPLHASQEPVTGPAAEQKTIDLLKHLLELEGPLGDAARENLSRELIVVPVAEQLALFTEKWNHTEYFIHMKRLFNSIATMKKYPSQISVLVQSDLFIAHAVTLAQAVRFDV